MEQTEPTTNTQHQPQQPGGCSKWLSILLMVLIGGAFGGLRSYLKLQNKQHPSTNEYTRTEKYNTIVEDGVTYRVYSIKRVAYVSKKEDLSSYTGVIRVKESVTYKRRSYPVVGIDEEAFAFDEELEEVILPPGIKEIRNNAFEGCSMLQRINFPAQLQEIGFQAFRFCKQLKEVQIPAYCSIRSDAFSYCTALERFVFLEETAEQEVSSSLFSGRIEGGAFSYCYALNQVEIRHRRAYFSGADLLMFIDSYTPVFHGCGRLSDIQISDSCSLIHSVNGLVLSGDSTTLLLCPPAFAGKKGQLTLPDCVTRIDNYAFAGCNRLTQIHIPKTVEYIGQYAFKGCTKAVIVIDNPETQCYDNSFEGCKGVNVK